MMDLTGKRVVVVGLAQTGISVAKFVRSRGGVPIANDFRTADELGSQIEALGGVAELALGGHDIDLFTGCDLVVMSPGVPELDAMRAARDAGVEVIAEIELAYRFFHPAATLIAITGTNGKSTTTALCGALCEASGRPTFCGGNLGNHPLIDAVDHPANSEGGLIVAEVAGFMLETCNGFRPHIGACLNITPDHLDRYGTLDVYASMKRRVFKWQRPTDYAIANARCERSAAGAHEASSREVLFDSAQTGEGLGAELRDGGASLVLRLPDGEESYPSSDLSLIGTHNLENAMAAYLAARLAKVKPDAIRQGARAFVPQPHRMELVEEVNGVVYFDDSKGTNVAAVAASMRGFPRPVVLIAGGVDKGGSYDAMFEALADVAKGLIVIGEAAPIIRAAAEAYGVKYPIETAQTMEDAVTTAAMLAKVGDAVVLSPACSSYDMFKNFGERGDVFQAAVRRLARS